MYNRICGFRFCLFILIVCVFPQMCHAARKGPGIAALESGIENYENGNYDDAILKLEIALIQIPAEDREGLWKAQFYLGLSYHHTGEYVEAMKKFNRIVELYEETIVLNVNVEPDKHRTEDTENSVRVKGELLVQNGLALKVITKKETTIRKDPDSSSLVVDNVGVFKTLFVFSLDQGSNKQGTTTNGFYRVGLTPDTEKIMGWINGKDVQEWNHREVVKFAPLAGRKLAKIYKTKKDLIAVIKSGDPDAREAIAEELQGLSAKRYKTFLPILDISNENIGKHNEGLYQIAFLDSPDIFDDEFMVLKSLVDIPPVEKELEYKKFNFSTGWVQLEQGGIPVIEPHIMISDDELGLLSYILEACQFIMTARNNVDKIKKMFVHDLYSFSGHGLNEEEETFSDFLKKKLGIPIQTKLLCFTLAELKVWSEAQLKRRQENIRDKSKSLLAFFYDQSNWNAFTDDYSYAYVPIDLLP